MSSADLIQMIGGIASLVCLLGGAIWWCLQRYLNGLHRQIQSLEEKNKKLDNKLNEARVRCTQLENQHALLSTEVKHLNDAKGELKIQFEFVSSRKEMQEKKIDELKSEVALLRGNSKEAELAETRKTLQALQEERLSLRRKLSQAQEKAGRQEARATELEQKLEQRISQYEDEHATLRNQIDILQADVAENQKRATKAETDLLLEQQQHQQTRADADRLTEQIANVVRQDERVWERPVTSGPPFRPLSERRVPIIAVLNLKGGVGKTTITANLTGLLAKQGKKVLAIDADYQRSLSMLLVPDQDRRMLHLEQRTLQEFLNNSTRSITSLLHAATEVEGLPGCWVVTNSDRIRRDGPVGQSPAVAETSLEDIEMRLMCEWMFNPAIPDVRLHFRRALHDASIGNRGYHYVLIDCPPRLSTTCINALAASDFILIPVLLDATSARAVPNLLRLLRRLRSSALFPHLKILGVLANAVSVRAGALIAQQAKTWSDLLAPCREAWGEKVHLFQTRISDSQQFADAAGGLMDSSPKRRLAIMHEDIKSTFEKLLQEIQERITHESQVPATVSA